LKVRAGNVFVAVVIVALLVLKVMVAEVLLTVWLDPNAQSPLTIQVDVWRFKVDNPVLSVYVPEMLSYPPHVMVEDPILKVIVRAADLTLPK